MKPLLAFMAGLLIFSGGGMRGRLGSVIAAFIDPGALVEITVTPPTDNTNTPTTRDLTPDEKKMPGLGGNPGIPPGTLQPGANNSCPQGYVYSPSTKLCQSLAGV